MPDAGAASAAGSGRRVLIVTLVVAVVVAGLIWNLVFDLWIGQAERQYLWENARHELHLGPSVSLKTMMDEARASGVWVASAWSLLVAVGITFASWYGYRQGRKS